MVPALSLAVLVLGGVLAWALRRRPLPPSPIDPLQRALEAADLGAWYWTRGDDRLHVNDRWLTMLGYADSVVVTTELWADLVHPDDLPAVHAAVAAHHSGAEPQHESTHRMRHADGTYRWIRSRARILERDAEGRTLLVVGTHQDVTEEVEAQHTRMHQALQHEALLAALPDLFFRLDRTGVYRDVQAPDPAHLLAPPETLLGRRLEDFLEAPQVQSCLQAIARALDSGTVQRHDFSLDLPTGTTVHYESFISPAGLDEVIVVVRDLTERVQQQTFLRHVIDASPCIIIVKDAQGRFVLANQAALETHGCSLDDLLGRTDADVWPISEEAARFAADDRHVLETGEMLYIDAEPVTDAEGHTRWFRTRKVRMEGATAQDHKLLLVSEDITEHRRLHHELASSEAWLQRILDSITDALIVLDEDWRFTKVNPQAEKLLGLTAAELIGRDHWELYADAIGSTFYREYHRAIETREPVTFEEYYPGHGVWYAVRAYPFDGGLAIFFSDITDERQRESYLRLRQERMQFLYEITAQGDLHFDEQIERTLHRTADLFGMEFGVLSHIQGDTYTVISAVAPVEVPLPPGTPFPLEDTICSVTFAGDDIVAVHHIGASELNSLPPYAKYGAESYIGLPLMINGEKFGTLSFSSMHPHEPFTQVDVETMYLLGQWIAAAVARQQSLDALRESEERFRLVAENMQDLVCLHDPRGTFTWISPSIIPLLGFTPDELVGTDPFSLFHPEDAAPNRIKVLSAFRHGVPESSPLSTYRMRRKDGSYIWIETVTDPVTDESGAIVALQSVSRDVTLRIEAMEALLIAREQAEAADQAKSAFLANMSHEIRTPLNGIVGVAELLDQTTLDPVQREYVGILRASSDTLLTLINDILDVSKIEAGQMELAPEPFSPADLARASVELMRFKAQAKHLSLALHLADDLPATVVGDDARLRQVLLNLLSNAVKFTAEGTVTLRVATQPAAPGHVALRFVVEDQGIGIPPDKLGQLFQRFNQVDSSRTKKYGGTGLGLAISRQLIELMNGDIGVESVYGEGSSFWFTLTLPLADAPAPEHTAAALADATPAEHLKGLRLLVVEDNRVNQRVILRMLETMNLTADVANHGLEALDRFDEQPYDLVFMDVQMPEMDGFACTAALRARDGIRPWIIGLTANALAGDRDAVLDSGMDDYLPKPLRRDALEEALLRVPAAVVAAD